MNKSFILFCLGGVFCLNNLSYSSELYQCTPCPDGFLCENSEKKDCPDGYFCQSGFKFICDDYFYCDNKSATKCESGYVCPSGTMNKIPLSQCQKTLVKSFTTSGLYNDYKLPVGIFLIEVASAGGGGGGSYGGYSSPKKYYTRGGNGGNGELKTDIIYNKEEISTIAVLGAAGAAGGDRSDGKNADDSYFAIRGIKTVSEYVDNTGKTHYVEQNGFELKAEGGKAGGGGSKHDGGKDATNTGNGQGGAGGAGGKKDSYPRSHPGNKGSDGWIKIYKISC